MNLSDTFLAENEDFKYVSVVFAPYTGVKEYTYKTLLSLAKDDFIVVQTPSNGYQVVQVREVLEPLEAELSDHIRYKWVVQKIDFDNYEQCKLAEKEINQRLRKAENRKRIEELKSSAASFLNEDERAEVTKLVRL